MPKGANAKTGGESVPQARSAKSRTKRERDPERKKPRRDGHGGTLWTVGHSTRSIKEFLTLLEMHGIRQIVDVRSIPRSRHNPQFNQDRLAVALAQAGIGYRNMPALGGLRHARRDSVNSAWRNASFRGYADYMQTPEFAKALQELIRSARERRTAILCAEAVPWRCHHSLIADALVVRGFHVEEIVGKTGARSHVLTPWARVVGVHITYPAAGSNTASVVSQKFVA